MESASMFNDSQSCFQCILTCNIHIDSLVLWFTKAIVCCTSKCSCISPVDVNVIVSTFPSCTTPVFPWFLGFSIVQVMFGST